MTFRHHRLAIIVWLTAASLALHAQPSAFEVASVKPSNPNSGAGRADNFVPPAPDAPAAPAPPPPGGRGLEPGASGGRPGYQVDHHRYATTNFSLFALMLQAYDVKGCTGPGEASCGLISGGPPWLKTATFDIEAKSADTAPEYTMTQFVTGQAPQLRWMLQSLLADRFKLKLHREMKQLPVYELNLAKSGSKLKLSNGTGSGSLLWGMTRLANGDAAVRLTGQKRSTQEFADSLSNIAGRPVLDRTGLTGAFDFGLEYPSDGDVPGATPFAGPSMFTAFQEQLGLKLDATKASVEVLVIDSAEKPSPN